MLRRRKSRELFRLAAAILVKRVKTGYNKSVRCLFLYNPNSGKGKIAKKLPLIERKLKERFGEVICRATKSGEDLEQQARAGAEEFDAVVFSGGDGTFHHVLQGIGERNVLLGYLPSGTANDVAKSLGIPKRLKGALKVIEKGRAEAVDCMKVNGSHYAMYIAAAGAFTCVTYDTPQREKRLLGKAAYILEGFKNMDYEPFPLTVTCGGKTVSTRAAIVFVLNGRFVAGFPMNKRASVQDGVLEVVILEQSKPTRCFSRFRTLCLLAHLFLLGKNRKKKGVTVLQGERVEIVTGEDVLWDFDGEKGMKGNVEIAVLPRRITMIVPKNKKL